VTGLRSILGAALLGLAGPAAAAAGQDITPASALAVQALLRSAAAPAISMPVWTSHRDAPPAAYRRNPSVWTGVSVDLTGKAVWNSRNGAFGTTAISPLHVVYAHHAGGVYPPGTIVRFVANDNSPVERIVVSSANIGGTDLDLSTLDAALPETIHWFKVMPEHWFLHCSRQSPGTLGTLPCLVMDGNTQSVSVKDLEGFYPGNFATQLPADPLRLSFSRDLRGGDSGSPLFILVGGQLVLDGIYHTPRSGVEVSANIAALDAAMKGSGYQVTVADLAGGLPH
jgi:hypothetical protein